MPLPDTTLRPSSVLSAVFLPLHLSSLPPALYLSAIRQIVASLICIVSPAIPTGAPRSCSLKDSRATAPSHWPIPWINLTLGQHQHIMNYGHLPPQTHCSLCSNVENIEGPGPLGLLTAYSLSYLLGGVRACASLWERTEKARVKTPASWPLPRIQSIRADVGVVGPGWRGRPVRLVIFWGKSRSCHLWNFKFSSMKPPPVVFFFLFFFYFFNVRLDLAEALIQIQTRLASGCPELFNRP